MAKKSKEEMPVKAPKLVKAGMVTRAEVRDMEKGETKIFIVTERAQLESGRSTVTTIGRLNKRKYTASADYDKLTFAVTRVS